MATIRYAHVGTTLCENQSLRLFFSQRFAGTDDLGSGFELVQAIGPKLDNLTAFRAKSDPVLRCPVERIRLILHDFGVPILGHHLKVFSGIDNDSHGFAPPNTFFLDFSAFQGRSICETDAKTDSRFQKQQKRT
jgi:hypothetical protein